MGRRLDVLVSMARHLEHLVISSGVLGPLLFVALYVALTVLMVPGSIRR